MLEIKKSKIEKIQEKEKWNDLFKFERIHVQKNTRSNVFSG